MLYHLDEKGDFTLSFDDRLDQQPQGQFTRNHGGHEQQHCPVHHHQHHQHHCHNHCQPFCPTVTVFDPPIRVERNICHPQLVKVIHPIEVVNRHHCVPVYQHCYETIEKHDSHMQPKMDANHIMLSSTKKQRKLVRYKKK